ncbi:MAG: cytochrome c [Acidobacteria bacterium]|nr:cytochrome c [Acidobacteriota bacterium]
MNRRHSAVLCAAIGCAVFAIATMQPVPAVSAGSKAKMRGKELFAAQGCVHCHGPAGVGGAEGPDLQLVRKRMKKAQIAQQIHDGGKSMPAYGDILSDAQISDLVAYLRAKRKLVPVAAKAVSAAPAPDASASDPN